MKTQAQLFTEALSNINAVGSGETASAEDVAIAAGALGPLLSVLASRQVCNVVTTDDTTAEEIPDELFDGLADLLSMNIRAKFGLPRPTRQEREDAMNVLRAITATPPTYETLEATYF